MMTMRLPPRLTKRRCAAAIESVRKAPWGDLYEVVVRGSGRRKIAVLSDPNCPYCKRLEEGLATPTWFLESGERYSGALPLDEIRRLLDEASPAKR